MRETLELIDKQIREGQGERAARELQALPTRKLPREEASYFASLCRRTSQPLLGIRVLNPIVRPDRKKPTNPTVAETAEYAACLGRLGAHDEALNLLEEIDAKEYPRTLMFQVFSLVARWDYDSTIPLLRKYLGMSDLTEYERLVAEANLLAAYVVQHSPESQALAAKLLKVTKEKGHKLLYGNVLDLAAQSAIYRRSWDEANGFLKEGERALQEFGGVDALFIRKWRAASELLQKPSSKSAFAALEDVRQEAVQRKHWETIRSCDIMQATATKDQRLFEKIYFGSPWVAFRERLRKDFSSEFEVPSVYRREMGSGGSPFQIADGSFGKSRLRPGMALHRMLAVLCSDFYRPFRIASLHAGVFPDDFFNPRTSPAKTHRIIQRLRTWFRSARVPLEINDIRDGYLLEPVRPIVLEIAEEIIPSGRASSFMRDLRSWFGTGDFSIGDVAEKRGCTSRTALYLLEEALKEGKVQRTGKARATRYRLVSGKGEKNAVKEPAEETA